ncbi:MAG TPA: hypothetical protein VFA89_02855 [Terriglobales bacterium]|nr:hypothetical protein [Terriglobales bacterium]
MLSLHTRIEKTRRLLKNLQEDQQRMARRLAELKPEHREASKRFAAEIIAMTEAELEKLVAAHSVENDIGFPAPAD